MQKNKKMALIAISLSIAMNLIGFSNEEYDMSLLRWKPFFNDLEEFDKPFRDQGFDLAIDLYEEDNNVIAKMHVPGIDADDIDIYIDEYNHLHISGERSERKEEKEKDYYHKEIRQGSFQRVIPIHAEIDEDQITATVENGVLTIIMPKTMEEQKQVKKIKVQRK